jgi:hypothetical protein
MDVCVGLIELVDPTNFKIRRQIVPRSFRSLVIVGCSLAFVCSSFGLLSPSVSFGQGRKSKTRKSPSSLRALDSRAQRALDSFLKETAETALQYEKAGQLEKSKVLLRTLLKLKPSLKGVKEKLKELNESQLEMNATDFTVDTGKGWGPARVRVFKGRPLRINTEGTYKFVTSLKIGPEGFPVKSAIKGDMVLGIPTGAMMGIIASKGKAGKPFLIGLGKEITPKEDGLLFIYVNVPPGHKCSGKIKVEISGSVVELKP